MKDLKAWLRVGDADDYHPFDSLDAAVEELHYWLHATTDELWEPGDGPCPTGGHQVERCYAGVEGVAIIGSGLTGNNSVSLYWGDDDAQKVAALSDSELEHVRMLLGHEQEERMQCPCGSTQPMGQHQCWP